MKDVKKNYLAPQIIVVKIESSDLICTSNQQSFGIQPRQGYEEEDW